MSRRHDVPATLPFFIPLPLPPFGTLGAVIKMKGRINDRSALLDIGSAGPLTGFFFTIPAIIIGLKLSDVVAVKNLQTNVTALGDSLLFRFLQWLVLGNIPAGYDVVLHPIAYAGWVGLFVTALNLLPIGQLDGGHVVYALLGKKSRFVSYSALGFLAFICLVYNPGWLLLLILLSLFGLKHPSPLDEVTPLDKKRYLIGILALLIFIFSFTPIPFPQYADEIRNGLGQMRENQPIQI
ncbi:MAG: site-2 protease family protein [Candidatus Schekmanbacteria bacterium]|nr:site-2 protease family protein [Candidatus Schekmanbacteria bacterium]